MFNPVEICLRSLVFPRDPFSLPADNAFLRLRRLSKMDFGDNISEWVRWAKAAGYVDESFPDNAVNE